MRHNWKYLLEIIWLKYLSEINQTAEFFVNVQLSAKNIKIKYKLCWQILKILGTVT